MKIQTEKIIEIVKETKPLFMNREQSSKIREKGLADFVTQVDIQVQEQVKQDLSQLDPAIQFMGEEKDNSEIDFTKDVWILDPVDGTTNLIHDFRNSTLSLALCEGGILTLGIVYHPYSDELFLARRGEGAWCNGVPIHVSGAEKMSQSLISVGTSPYYKELAEENFALFQKIFMESEDIRRLGSAALELAYVASGRTEAYLERHLKPWDYAAGVLLIEEAGGMVTDYQGKPVDVTKPSDIVGSNGKIGTILTKEFL